MAYADVLFKNNIEDILIYGAIDENPRPRYASDGVPAHSIFITQVFEKYEVGMGIFPITELRPIAVENGIKEIRWIYQDQTSSLDILEQKYGIKWWRDWDIGNGTIGQRYGATVREYDLMNNFLDGLKRDPFGRRHILSLWQEKDFRSKQGLNPCAFQILGTPRRGFDGLMYFDMTLTQRSSDYLVAGHINKMQYVALQMMIAKHCGYELGTFAHFVQNLHIYVRHVEQAEILLSREVSGNEPKLLLNVEDGTNFYDITHKDFELIDYEPIKPQLKFDLGV
jgi:thymidylate synthase